MFRKLLLVCVIALASTACTPHQVEQLWPGTHRPESAQIARHLTRWWGVMAYVSALQSTPEGEVRAAAREFGIPEDAFVRVIQCESQMNPYAVNASSGALGLGQHLPQYWGGRAAALGYSYDDWSDARANARVSAWLWATSGPQNWVCY